jgi:hypothetical protein
MGIQDAIRKTLHAVREQLTYSSKPSKAIHFTNSFQAKAKAWRLTEKDALDVYQHGEQVKDHIIVRKYQGYELGIWYFTDSRTGQPVITSIWKRERR